jgi:nucleolar MIF4G domain-containing protein 1
MGKSKRDKKEKAAPVRILTRKEKRKEGRKAKKELKKNFYVNRFGGKAQDEDCSDYDQEQQDDEVKIKREQEQKKDALLKLKEASEARRKKLLQEANQIEEMNLKRLEKQLNLNKRKGKNKESDTLHKSFVEDGFDFILDACDPAKLSALQVGNDFSDDEEEDDDDEQKPVPKLAKSAECDDEEIESNEDEIEGEISDVQDSESNDDDDVDQIGNAMNDDEDSSEEEMVDGNSEEEEEDDDDHIKSDNQAEAEEKESTKDNEKQTWEDIYGRKRDADGNVVQTKYVPPAKRVQQGRGDLTRLEKQIKGQLNRLAESNMQGIARQIEDLFARNSRNDMNECLIKILTAALISPNALTPERLVMEHAVLIAILHANVGIEVGATLTQKWIEAYTQEYAQTDRDGVDKCTKVLDNYLQFVSYLYAFQVVGHGLMFDLLATLSEGYKVKDIELIILVLRYVGFNLRKDDASRLKTLIIDIQRKSSESSSGDTSMRVKFMLETLMAIRNNNVKKLANYDPTHQVHLLKLMRNFLRPGAEVTTLNVKLDDLLNADTQGRWWIVGSAWTGRVPEEAAAVTETTKKTAKYSEELLKLARKMRMNTDARKAIFCALMSSSDFMDAFEKLVKVGLKSPVKERETAFVLTTCCAREPKFNPFYPHVAAKLARYERKFRMAVQCAIWDRIGMIIDSATSSEDKSNCVNLGLFTSTLIRDKVLTLMVLKKIEFADMNKGLTLFLRTLISDLLKEDNDRERNLPFAMIAGNPKLSMLRESLRLFMHHFLLKNKKVQDEQLKSRLEAAESSLLLTSSSK